MKEPEILPSTAFRENYFLWKLERDACSRIKGKQKLCCFHVTALGFIHFGRKDGATYLYLFGHPIVLHRK